MIAGDNPSPPPDPSFLRWRSRWQRLIRSNFARNVATTYASYIHLMVCNFVASIIIARTLGPAGRGDFFLAVTAVNLGVQFGSLGLQMSMTLLAAKHPAKIAELLGNTALITLFAGVFSVIAGVIVAPFWPASKWLLSLALANIPFNLGFMLMQGILVGVNAVGTRNLQDVGGNFVRLGLVAALWHFGSAGVEAYFAAGLVVPLAGIAMGLSRLWPHLRHGFQPSWPLAREALQYGCKAYLVATFAFLATRVFDFLAVRWWFGKDAAGCYSIAQQLAQTMALFPQVVGILIFPRFCRSPHWLERVRMVRKVTTLVGAAMIPAVIAAWFLARPFIALCFGRDFAPAAEPFQWFLPGIFIWSIEVQFRLLLQSDDVSVSIILGWIATAGISAFLNFVLVPRFGMTGGAMATTASFGCMAVLTFCQMFRETRAQHSKEVTAKEQKSVGPQLGSASANAA
jgi:O-antigen/teichoic acid export membrane protein